MAARRTPAAGRAAGDLAEVETPKVPDFEVVGDELVCHKYGDLRLSLVVSMAKYQEWVNVDNEFEDWPETIVAWQERAMPDDVREAIRRESERDFAANFELSKQWGYGLAVRLGKALS